METRVFAIEKGSLISLTNWLVRQPIPGMKSRERTRFVEAVRPEIAGFQKWRIDLVKEYAEVDEKGGYVLVEDDYGRQNYDMSEENRKKVEDVIATKLNEKFKLSIGPELEKSYAFVKNFILNTSVEFSGPEADEYDKWCSAFENDKNDKTEKTTEAEPQTAEEKQA